MEGAGKRGGPETKFFQSSQLLPDATVCWSRDIETGDSSLSVQPIAGCYVTSRAEMFSVFCLD